METVVEDLQSKLADVQGKISSLKKVAAEYQTAIHAVEQISPPQPRLPKRTISPGVEEQIAEVFLNTPGTDKGLTIKEMVLCARGLEWDRQKSRELGTLKKELYTLVKNWEKKGWLREVTGQKNNRRWAPTGAGWKPWGSMLNLQDIENIVPPNPPNENNEMRIHVGHGPVT